MLFLGFISGKKNSFPGKCAKTLKNPGSLTSTQSGHGDEDNRLHTNDGEVCDSCGHLQAGFLYAFICICANLYYIIQTAD